jgi:hypothetical protein
MYIEMMHFQMLSRVRAIEEKFQSARNAVITDFKSMLRECKDIISTSRWTKVSFPCTHLSRARLRRG